MYTMRVGVLTIVSLGRLNCFVGPLRLFISVSVAGSALFNMCVSDRAYASVSVMMKQSGCWDRQAGREDTGRQDAASNASCISRCVKSFIIQKVSILNGRLANLPRIKKNTRVETYRPVFIFHHSTCNYSFIDLLLIVDLHLCFLHYFIQEIFVQTAGQLSMNTNLQLIVFSIRDLK